MAEQRVKWKHDCPNPDHCGYERGGTVWIPKYANEHTDFYEAAKALGLTADPPPDPGRAYSMVDWDCRPGALQMHYWDDLEIVAAAGLGKPQ
jgi:hypothetical protein